MGEDSIIKFSLRQSLLNDIESFLEAEGFNLNAVAIEGVLSLINLVSDYYEEGQHLYPEIIITQDISIFQTIPSYKIKINTATLELSSFKHAIKLCAPLAINSWVIYIEIKDDNINFGLVSTEKSETSLSLHRQTLNRDLFYENATFAYIRSFGQKVVEIKGLDGSIQVYLNLDEEKELTENKMAYLAHSIVAACSDDEDRREKLSIFFEKKLDDALKSGHGNLIAVVEDREDSIQSIKEKLSDGIYLEEPINMTDYVLNAEEEKSNESFMLLKSYSSLMKSMMNHDGITLFTNTGKILGYHLFIKATPDEKAEGNENVSTEGGARSRAFEVMKRLNFKACFYKSQDGNTKYHGQK